MSAAAVAKEKSDGETNIAAPAETIPAIVKGMLHVGDDHDD